MNPYEYLTREERIRRIGEILAKGIALMHAAQAEAARKAAEAPVVGKVEQEERDWIIRAMVDYMKKSGWSTPREMVLNLDVKRTTLFRRLQDLRKRGLIESRGNTRGTQYRLAAAQG